MAFTRKVGLPIKELGIDPDHPAWVVPPPPIQFSSPPMAYSPILLPGFNEVEYTLAPAEGEDGHDALGQGNEDVVGHENELVVEGVVVAGGTDGVEDEEENHLEE